MSRRGALPEGKAFFLCRRGWSWAKIGIDRFVVAELRKGIVEPNGSHLRKRLHEHVDLGFAEHEFLA